MCECELSICGVLHMGRAGQVTGGDLEALLHAEQRKGWSERIFFACNIQSDLIWGCFSPEGQSGSSVYFA